MIDDKKIIVTSYINPDLDGTACSYAYAELLQSQNKNATAMISGTPFIEAQWVLNKLNLTIPPLKLDGDEDIILTDISSPTEIDLTIPLDHVIQIIDHRKYHKAHLFTNATVQIELIGAAATMIAEKFHKANIKPSNAAATLLYGGIVSNTINFKATVTTKRDRDMAEWLKEEAHISNLFIHDMFAAKSDLKNKPLKGVIDSDTPSPKKIGTKTLSIGQLEIIDAKKLYQTRADEIIQALKDMKKEYRLDFFMLSTIDLIEGKNYFLYTTNEEKEIIIQLLGAHTEKNYLVRDTLILRKEIFPILVKYFSP